MNFVDEEERLAFHKANTYMQLLAQTFESLCFEYGIQVTVIEVIDSNNAVIGAALEDDAALAVLDKFNKLYGRTRNDPSLHLLDAEDSLWLVHGDEGKNLKNLN